MGTFGARLTEIRSSVNYVEYLESSGTQYIDTGLMANTNTRVVLDFMYLSGSGIFGSFENGKDFALEYAGGKWYTYYGNNHGYGTAATANRRCIADVNRNVATVDGVVVRTATANTFSATKPFLLFCFYNRTAPDYFSSIRVYSCQIYDNGTLVRDLWPAFDPEGVACLYDKVEQKYYYNAGTGSFIAEGGGHIVFTVNGTPYMADSGMTWAEWVDSDYNTAGATISGQYVIIDYDCVCLVDLTYVAPTDTIMSGYAYETTL